MLLLHCDQQSKMCLCTSEASQPGLIPEVPSTRSIRTRAERFATKSADDAREFSHLSGATLLAEEQGQARAQPGGCNLQSAPSSSQLKLLRNLTCGNFCSTGSIWISFWNPNLRLRLPPSHPSVLLIGTVVRKTSSSRIDFLMHGTT